MARYPAPGTKRRQIMDMLPASNAEIGDALEMHNGEVARTLAALIHAGHVINANSGSGNRARYLRVSEPA